MTQKFISYGWTTNSCSTKKRVYSNRSEAKSAARLLAKRGQGNLRPYLCNKCGSIHIGHPSKITPIESLTTTRKDLINA